MTDPLFHIHQKEKITHCRKNLWEDYLSTAYLDIISLGTGTLYSLMKVWVYSFSYTTNDSLLTSRIFEFDKGANQSFGNHGKFHLIKPSKFRECEVTTFVCTLLFFHFTD